MSHLLIMLLSLQPSDLNRKGKATEESKKCDIGLCFILNYTFFLRNFSIVAEGKRRKWKTSGTIREESVIRFYFVDRTEQKSLTCVKD